MSSGQKRLSLLGGHITSKPASAKGPLRTGTTKDGAKTYAEIIDYHPDKKVFAI